MFIFSLSSNCFNFHFSNGCQNKYEVQSYDTKKYKIRLSAKTNHGKAKINHLLKCPTKRNYIEKWKNCIVQNHVTPSYGSDNHSCIIGSIDKKIIFQVSFPYFMYLHIMCNVIFFFSQLFHFQTAAINHISRNYQNTRKMTWISNVVIKMDVIGITRQLKKTQITKK